VTEPFRVIAADPPWQMRDNLPGPSRGAAKNYPTLSVAELCAFRLPPLASDCHLFLWRLSSMPQEALDVIKAWGFVPKSEIVWRKQTSTGKRHFGMGRQVRLEHETCIIATRGRPAVVAKNIRSTFDAPTGIHSEKPERFYTEIVEQLCAGPYIELFSRRLRPGWFAVGNEIGAPGAALKRGSRNAKATAYVADAVAV